MYVEQDKEQLNARYEDNCNEMFRVMEEGGGRMVSDKVGKELWVFSVIEDNPMEASESELPPYRGRSSQRQPSDDDISVLSQKVNKEKRKEI